MAKLQSLPTSTPAAGAKHFLFNDPRGLPCISLWRPWADWVALGWKEIETRTHNRFRCLIGYRIGIHAAQKWDQNAIEAARPYLTDEQIRLTRGFSNTAGSIVCTATVIFGRSMTETDSRLALIECRTPRFGLFLRGIRIISDMQGIKGGQGIFYVKGPPDYGILPERYFAARSDRPLSESPTPLSEVQS